MSVRSGFSLLLLRCMDRRWRTNETVAVAISGGADSMCLAYLLAQYRNEHRTDVSIVGITIDHQYRAGSGVEARDVGRTVLLWGIKHQIVPLKYNVDVHSITNFEEVARTKRYQEMQKVCEENDILCLYVGHNMDDQLETYLQRLRRNSSLFGLVGLKPVSRLPVQIREPDEKVVNVYRPLLEYSKEEIVRTCRENGVVWHEDTTNSDIHLTERNRLRYLLNEVIPKKELYRSISKQELALTCTEITLVVKNIRQKAQLLQLEADFSVDLKNGSITLKLPSKFLQGEHQLVLSQFLYRILYSVSSVKHYHWSYAKVERRLIPKIAEIVAHPRSSLKLTYLNLFFTVAAKENIVRLTIERQPLLRYQEKELQLDLVLGLRWSDWVLFDNRFWIRAKHTKDIPISIVPYNHLVHRAYKIHGEPPIFGPNLNTVPVVVSGDHILALPLYNLHFDPSLSSQCRLKLNLTELSN